MILQPPIVPGTRASRRAGPSRRSVAAGACAWACALLWAAAAGGCDLSFTDVKNPPRATSQPVPPPINLLLPRIIHVHPLTGGPKELDPKTGERGFEVLLSIKDADGEAAKAFGDFRFELYYVHPNSLDPKGTRINVWEVSTLDRQANRKHWEEIRRMYQFALGWEQPIPVGTRLVLVVVFSSPFTERLFDEYTFVAGE